MQTRNPLWLMPALLLAAGPALADATLDDVSRLNAEIAVLTLKVKKAELQAQVERAVTPPTVQGLPSLPSMPPHLSLPPTPAFASAPVLSGIEGLDGNMTATLRHPNGTLERTEQGATASDGWRTIQIGNGQVVQQKKNEQRTLFMGAGAGTQAGQPSGAPALTAPAGTPR